MGKEMKTQELYLNYTHIRELYWGRSEHKKGSNRKASDSINFYKVPGLLLLSLYLSYRFTSVTH